MFDWQLNLKWFLDTTLLADIFVDLNQQQIKVVNYTDNDILRPFGNIEKPNWNDFEKFLESRCFPQNRHNLKKLLKNYGLPGYDPLTQVEFFEGRTAEDPMHIQFIRKGDVPA